MTVANPESTVGGAAGIWAEVFLTRCIEVLLSFHSCAFYGTPSSVKLSALTVLILLSTMDNVHPVCLKTFTDFKLWASLCFHRMNSEFTYIQEI